MALVSPVCQIDLLPPALAAQLRDDPAVASALLNIMECAFSAGQASARLDRLAGEANHPTRRRPKAPHRYAVSVVPAWLAA